LLGDVGIEADGDVVGVGVDIIHVVTFTPDEVVEDSR
jgi:hypothetical protein